jgi:hypothetical protein
VSQRHLRDTSPRSEPDQFLPSIEGTQKDVHRKMGDRSRSTDDSQKTAVGSTNGSLSWKEEKLAHLRAGVSESATHQESFHSSETSRHMQSRRRRYSRSSQSSVRNVGYHREQNSLFEGDSVDQRDKHTAADVPHTVLEDFYALRKIRTRMSYHWTRYREQYSYVRQESSDIASTVAIMNQELERNPPGSLFFGSNWHRLKLLAARIHTQHAELAISEAQLEEIQEQVLIQEQELRSAEQRLGSNLHVDDVSDISDMLDIEELLEYGMSLPATPKLESDLLSDIASVQLSPRRTVDGSRRGPLRLDEDVIHLDNHADAALSLEVDQSSQQATMEPYLATLTGDIVRQDAVVEYTGAQFARDEQKSEEVTHSSEDVLGASPLQSQKRTMDLNIGDSLQTAPSKMVDIELGLVKEWTITNPGSNMIDRMLHVVRSSWLEFSAFVHVLQEQWGFIKTYDVFKIDTLLRQNVCYSDISLSRRADSNCTIARASTSTQKLVQSLGQVSVQEDSTPRQPAHCKAKAQSLGGLSNSNQRVHDLMHGKLPVSLNRIVIELHATSDSYAQASEQSHTLPNTMRSLSLPTNIHTSDHPQVNDNNLV